MCQGPLGIRQFPMQFHDFALNRCGILRGEIRVLKLRLQALYEQLNALGVQRSEGIGGLLDPSRHRGKEKE